MNHNEFLLDAMRAFNAAEREAFTEETGTRWLRLEGPTYLLGDVRAKTFFIGTDGQHWADTHLVIESMSHVGTHGMAREHVEEYRELAPGITPGADLWVHTDTRGRWNASMAPVATIARAFGYPPPVALPGTNWGRTWWDSTERTDSQELAWIANGGNPLHTYAGGEL
ncbi:hypothetical protein OG233_13960 [Streptomyces sp. NBC_01218]|uniref:hypothetical protein n=1 Tax=Streptomyces sp. NBC_01218 TaxID=2903780 RepID=UPI002E131FCB|nr:hypothetical protein OG233_13960 [Streptomyces sp. NBC_01218]